MRRFLASSLVTGRTLPEPGCGESSSFLWSGSSELDAAGVFEDACHDPVGKLESAAPGSAIHDRGLARADGIEKGAQLGAKRFFRRGGKFLESDSGCGLPGWHTDAQRILAREIERDVFVLLEEAHLADALGGDAAGGDIGDGAGLQTRCARARYRLCR